jgi:hypothetical protein
MLLVYGTTNEAAGVLLVLRLTLGCRENIGIAAQQKIERWCRKKKRNFAGLFPESALTLRPVLRLVHMQMTSQTHCIYY